MLPASMATMAFFLVAVNSPGKSTEATADESSLLSPGHMSTAGSTQYQRPCQKKNRKTLHSIHS